MRLPLEPPTFLRLFTPQFDVTSVLPGLAPLALVVHLLGVRGLHRRGLPWPCAARPTPGSVERKAAGDVHQ